MQNYPDPIKFKEQNNRNALEIITQDLLISEKEKIKLLEDLRQLGLTDDSDPIIKLTLIQGLYAKYTGDMIRTMAYERDLFESSISEHSAIILSFTKYLDDFMKNIKVWKEASIIELENNIINLKDEKTILKQSIREEESKFNDIKKNSIICIFITLFIITISIIIGISIFQNNHTKNKNHQQYTVHD